jgi:hypothetical protein
MGPVPVHCRRLLPWFTFYHYQGHYQLGVQWFAWAWIIHD